MSCLAKIRTVMKENRKKVQFHNKNISLLNSQKATIHYSSDAISGNCKKQTKKKTNALL